MTWWGSVTASPNYKRKRGKKMNKKASMLLRVEQTKEGKIKLSKVVEYESGARVMVPIIRDGSIKWFDDSKLIKPESHKEGEE